MNEVDKIKRFMNDPYMADAVYGYLLKEFMAKNETNDVNHLAASRISIDLLQSAWKKMEEVQHRKSPEEKDTGQIAL